MPRSQSSNPSRRGFAARVVAMAAAAFGVPTSAQQSGGVRGIDHVALPMRNTEAMLAFYRGLGFDMRETPNLVSVYVGDQMINFHRPAFWQSATFTLRAPAATPPCGDLCFVWDDTAARLTAALERVGAGIIEGPVDRQGGRRRSGSSVYVRDPDGNLLEFLIYS